MPTSAQARRACAQSFWCALKVPLVKSTAAKELIMMMRDIAVSNRRGVGKVVLSTDTDHFFR
jgi:hypothetical protein